jgi:hypothetical protein
MFKLTIIISTLLLVVVLFNSCSKKDDFSDDENIVQEYHVKGTFDGRPLFVAHEPSKRSIFGYDFTKRKTQTECLFRVNSGLGANYGVSPSSDKSGYSLFEPYIEIRLLNLKPSDNACSVDEDAFLHILRPRVFSFYNDVNYNAPDLVDIILRDEKGVYWRLANSQNASTKFEILKTKQADVIINFVEIIGAKAKCKLTAKMTNGSKIIDVDLDFVWRFSRVL